MDESVARVTEGNVFVDGLVDRVTLQDATTLLIPTAQKYGEA